MWKERYNTRKPEFLSDKTICKENRKLFGDFLDWEEIKLKRKNNLRELDESCYNTLYCFINRLSNVNQWFGNKPLKNISKEDIIKVYHNLEDGKILNSNGKPFKDRKSYYNKLFKSKLFRMVGKDELARDVIEFSTPIDNEVRFIREDKFRKLESVIIKPEHKLLTWLVFDISENVNAMLQLKKKNCRKEINPDTNEHEYHITFPKEILKRKRTARTEITNYQETVKLLDILLQDKKDDDLLFNFEYRNAKKFLDRAQRITKVVCEPKGQPVTWKDLRSSCACDLLIKKWTTDEINSRLGHKPSSREIDKYVNYLAIDRHKPKKKIHEHNLAKLNDELKESRELAKLEARRREKLEQQMAEMLKNQETMRKEIIKIALDEIKKAKKN